MEKITSISRSWRIKDQAKSDYSYYSLDARLCELRSIKQQLNCFVASLKNVSELFPKSMEKFPTSEFDLPSPDRILSADFSYNELDSMTFSDLAAFGELRRLVSSFNSISDFTGILSCPNLTYLCLSYNSINKFPVAELKECPHLIHMDFRSNLIDDISNLVFLPNLQHLNLSFNLLTNLDGLQALPSLVELHVQHNRIEDIAGTSTCFALKLLDLSHNNLHSVSHVVDSLRSLRKLQRITIKENFEEYSELLPASTSVKILDGKVIVNAVANLAPPSNDDDVKSSLKSRLRDSVEDEARKLDAYRGQQLHYIFSKIRCFNTEIEDKKQENEESLMAWLSYIDSLSPQEAAALSRRNLNTQSVEKNESENKNLTMNRTKNFDTNNLLAEVSAVLSRVKE